MRPAADSRPVAPLLIIAVGNPSRGDDALGPLLLEQLRNRVRPGEVELLEDFQLQIEHALDLVDRHAVLFVDAALPGHVNGVSLQELDADDSLIPASHALQARSVLAVACQINGSVPPAWQLGIEGHSFELGEGLSDSARTHLAQATALAMQWLSMQGADTDYTAMQE